MAPNRRTLAFGIVSAAGSVGTMLTAPIAAYLLNHDSWRTGLWAFVILAVAMLPAALIGSRADRLPNSRATDRNLTLMARSTRRAAITGYVVMSIAFFVCGLQLVFLTTHLPTYLAQCGMDAELQRHRADADRRLQHPELLAVRLAGRPLSQAPAAGRHLPAALGHPGRSSSCHPPTPLTVVLFGAAMGTLWLGVIPLVNGLVVQLFGLRFLSTLTGIAFLSHQAGSFLGAWGGGYLFDLMGSYDLAWKIGVLVGLVAGTAAAADERPADRAHAGH